MRKVISHKMIYKMSASIVLFWGTFLSNGLFFSASELTEEITSSNTPIEEPVLPEANPNEVNTSPIGSSTEESSEVVSDQNQGDGVQSDIGLQPVSLKITSKALSEKEISLSWNHSNEFQSYEISREGELLVTLTANGENVITYIDDTVAPNQSYEYSIQALGTDGLKREPVLLNVNSFDTVPPESPTNFRSLEVLLPNQIDLEWGEAEGASGYSIFRDGKHLEDVEFGSLFYSDLSAEPNLTYHYSIVAFDESGNQSSSLDISVLSLDTLPPSIPQIVEGKAAAANQVHLLWTSSFDNREMSHYNIYMKRTGGDFEYVGSSKANFFIHEGLGNSISYQYKITAVDQKGNESQFSDLYDVVTDEDAFAVVYEALPFVIKRDDVKIREIESDSDENKENSNESTPIENTPADNQEKKEETTDTPFSIEELPLEEENKQEDVLASEDVVARLENLNENTDGE